MAQMKEENKTPEKELNKTDITYLTDSELKTLVIGILKKLIEYSSGQDGGIGRNPSLPCTTKRSITTNLKSVNNQKCQKIKLQGIPTTKKLKKKSTRTTRLVKTSGAGRAS